ncbi:MAG: hypothetical protein IKJ88_01310 [Clostridia bacterium]|nr:hypothetical protein [Clostridia bacterium]MBR3974478.1 hypothetical protein [Clostridia bacterium]
MIFNSPEIPEHTIRAVNTLSVNGRIPQTVMLSGGNDALQKKCALELANAVMCSQLKNGVPCGTCSDCIKIKAGSHPDIINIVPEKDKKNVSKEQIDSLVLSSLYLSPNEAANKVYIFPDANSLSPVIQNALLKSIEEPPEFVMFIFLCELREKMLETIISRCVEFHLGDTLSAKIKTENEKVLNTAKDIVNALCKEDEFSLFLKTAPLQKNRQLTKQCAEKITNIVRDALTEGSNAPLLSGCELEAYSLARSFGTQSLLKIKDAMDIIQSDAAMNANENLLITRLSSLLAVIMKERIG